MVCDLWSHNMKHTTLRILLHVTGGRQLECNPWTLLVIDILAVVKDSNAVLVKSRLHHLGSLQQAL